ncbi:MAG: branched-chain amino acid ABC transporter permease [Betaproteobacteria bacterium]|nr:MAG: branched-chain amino acid ABC transporter permease [Betaproteobacteria bacterium]
MHLERAAVAAGTRASLPVLLGIAPFGMICGVAMVAGGIPPLSAVLMSVLVFAGASMLAATQLLAAGAPVALVVLTAFFVNLRFMMYSASMRLHLGAVPVGWRLLAACMLADNPYALSLARFADHPADRDKLAFFLGAAAPVWLCWQLAVILGVLVGARLPVTWQLEFAAPLAFIAISVPLLRDRAMIAAAAAAGVTVVLAHGLPLRLGLMLAALAGIAAGLLMERKAP